ncbi:NB-ARC domain-containing protein [Phytomonospora endophytica]|uniref:Tetratricopeptide (TPR) repeat protein n=1 Tax=Phytomonospora endophytica TaxID=714109 RepID=A0A841FQ51_9ACTN|nr:NB-ARC domain-containing protein [Phytomonospora endophytica]MBB6038216.1 tetratricopeptide (TPR) repeat protein [Phytomonospora endophytica]GIG67326.1 hypothetical protein Pen01_36210 [Phytomonospora endophytica]
MTDHDREPGAYVDASGARYVQVGDHNRMHVQAAPRPPVAWPHRIGTPPSLAAARLERGADRELAQSLAESGGTQILYGTGGVGKTQMAAYLAQQLWDNDELDLLVWVTAASREQITDAYARAALDLTGVEDKDPAHGAERFLTWLAGQREKRWLVVLDDLADPQHAKRLWPPVTATGRAVVTTRRQDAALDGHGRVRVPVGVFVPQESLEYLRMRLRADPGWLAEADGLAADLGHLPLALGHATAYMLDQVLPCAAYRGLFADRARRLEEVFPDQQTLPDEYDRTIATTWSLSVEAADRCRPIELAGVVLEAASLLDANGMPAWALDEYVQGPETIRQGLANLQRFSLVEHQGDLVRVHTLVQRMSRERCSDTRMAKLTTAVADRLLARWPAEEGDQEFCGMLRANARALHQSAGAHLFRRNAAHGVLLRSVESMGLAYQADAAVEYVANIYHECVRFLGADHPDAFKARYEYGRLLGQFGDVTAAIEVNEALLDDAVRVFGPRHRITFAVRGQLARWAGVEGDTVRSARVSRNVADEAARVYGSDDPSALIARERAAYQRGMAGDLPGAIGEYRTLVEDAARVLDPSERGMFMIRGQLAEFLGRNGDYARAVDALQELLPECVRHLGADHGITLTMRSQLARWRGASGDVAGAVAGYSFLLSECTRVFGAGGKLTEATREMLADWQKRLPGQS